MYITWCLGLLWHSFKCSLHHSEPNNMKISNFQLCVKMGNYQLVSNISFATYFRFFSFFPTPPFSPPICSSASSHPPDSSPLSHDSYQPRMMKADICFLQDMWNQPLHFSPCSQWSSMHSALYTSRLISVWELTDAHDWWVFLWLTCGCTSPPPINTPDPWP